MFSQLLCVPFGNDVVSTLHGFIRDYEFCISNETNHVSFNPFWYNSWKIITVHYGKMFIQNWIVSKFSWNWRKIIRFFIRDIKITVKFYGILIKKILKWLKYYYYIFHVQIYFRLFLLYRKGKISILVKFLFQREHLRWMGYICTCIIQESLIPCHSDFSTPRFLIQTVFCHEKKNAIFRLSSSRKHFLVTSRMM